MWWDRGVTEHGETSRQDQHSGLSDVGYPMLLEVVASMFAPATVEGTLDKIVGLAAHAISGCEAAGIMRVDADGIATVAASNALVDQVDRLQIETGEGPCVDAARQRTTVYVHDLVNDPRWPAFAPPAVDNGIRTVLACALPVEEPIVLNLYAPLPAAFGVTDRAQASLFASLARVALDVAQERASGTARTDNMAIALRTREIIGQAQGILIERERITAVQAFDVLRRASQHMNVKLREVAATLIETGETPDTGSPDDG